MIYNSAYEYQVFTDKQTACFTCVKQAREWYRLMGGCDVALVSKDLKVLSSQDIPLVLNYIVSFSSDDLYCRFHSIPNQAWIGKHYQGLDWDQTILIGYFEEDKMIGLVEIAVIDGSYSEIAVSVSAEFRRKGIGFYLTRVAADICAIRGYKSSILYFLPENNSIPRIVKNLGGRVNWQDHEAVLSLN